MMTRIAHSARSFLEGAPGGHDLDHTLRVAGLCLHVGGIEGGDPEILEAAALLHDIGRPAELRDPGIDHARISAGLAPGILNSAGFPVEKVPSVVHAIEHHRFSAHLEPASLEARILQDADRLDISGAMGVAMTFAYTGALGRRLYHPDDPLALHRTLDDREYALDHILAKLMQLPDSMHTETARQMARQRNQFLNRFIAQFVQEIRRVDP